MKDIESELGRIRGANKNGPRTIDLDILVFNNQIEDHDVFHRDFFKNPIVDLFPNLSPVLSCKNYMNNFEAIHRIIEHIKSTLPNKPISIFGAGKWFNNNKSATDNIDIIAIVKDADKQSNLLINWQLEALRLNIISELPVKVTLILLDELEGKSQEKDTQVLFTQQFASYKFLYGQELSC